MGLKPIEGSNPSASARTAPTPPTGTGAIFLPHPRPHPSLTRFPHPLGSSNCPNLTNLAANRKFAALGNRYPLHLGLTEAGPVDSGSVKSAMGIGILLAEGIGDTIRVSLVGEPEDEVRVGRQILANLQEKGSGPNLVACPTCGRLEIDMFPMVKRVEEALADVKRTITVSVMGCVVNGPGEGMHADIGIAGGRQKGILYRGGKVIATLPEEQLIDTLVEALHRIADEDARLLAEGKPLPSGAGDEGLIRLPVSAG